MGSAVYPTSIHNSSYFKGQSNSEYLHLGHANALAFYIDRKLLVASFWF